MVILTDFVFLYSMYDAGSFVVIGLHIVVLALGLLFLSHYLGKFCRVRGVGGGQGFGRGLLDGVDFALKRAGRDSPDTTDQR